MREGRNEVFIRDLFHPVLPYSVSSVEQDADVERNETCRVCRTSANWGKKQTTVAQQQRTSDMEKTNNQLLNRFANENGTAWALLRRRYVYVYQPEPVEPAALSRVSVVKGSLSGRRRKNFNQRPHMSDQTNNGWTDKLVTTEQPNSGPKTMIFFSVSAFLKASRMASHFHPNQQNDKWHIHQLFPPRAGFPLRRYNSMRSENEFWMTRCVSL